MSEPAAADDGALPELSRVRRAVLVVDVVESVRLMQAFEADVIARWRRFIAEVRTDVLPRHGGRLVKSLGDGLLLEFAAVRGAAAAAFELHQRIAAFNHGRRADAALALRAGAHVCEVVIDELDIYGEGVNTAARVTSLAAPGETIATVQFCDELLRGLDAECEDLGEIWVKHLDDALHCWRLRPPQAAGAVTLAPQPAAAAGAATTANVLVPRLAVMPLATLGLPPREATAGHLVADNLSARLSRGGVLRVISRLSSSALAGRGLTATEIAQRLGVQYLVAGTIVGRGTAQWRVTVELVDAADGTLLWTAHEDLAPAALLLPDDDFSAAMASELLDAIAGHQLVRLATHVLPSLQSYSLQLAGLRLMHRAARPDFERARAVLETLVERHPRAPVPRAWLSQWWVLRTTRGLAAGVKDEAAQALSHTRSALQTDPENALALATQGFVECHMLRDLDAAEHTLGQAIAANPNEPLAWLYRSVVHGFRGEGDAAWRCAETASSLSPLDPQRHYFDALTASAAITAGALARGIELARRALAVNRNHLPTLRALTAGLAEAGEIEAAREAAQRVLALAPDFTVRGYVAGAAKGSERTRERFGAAFARAGIPLA
jgi:class 3 adenylate cyclase/TolB-like protein